MEGGSQMSENTPIIISIGTLLILLVGYGKIIWFIATIKAQTDQNTKDINAAHDKIRGYNGKTK